MVVHLVYQILLVGDVDHIHGAYDIGVQEPVPSDVVVAHTGLCRTYNVAKLYLHVRVLLLAIGEGDIRVEVVGPPWPSVGRFTSNVVDGPTG